MGMIKRKEFVKGKKANRILVCNSVSQAQVEEARGMHPDYVFVYRREREKNFDMAPTMPYAPVGTMNNSGWQTARDKASLKGLHGHDLRHTTAMRLREWKVAHVTISDLLWHAHKNITSHYTLEQIAELAEAMELITKNAGRWNRTLDQLRKEKLDSVPKDDIDHKSV
jgi:integrase